MDKYQEQRKTTKQNTRGKNKMNPYKPRFMFQSTSLDVGVGQNEFQMGFKEKSRCDCQYLI